MKKKNGVIGLLVQQDSGLTLVVLRADQKKEEIFVECNSTTTVDEKYKQDVIMFVTRANFGLNLGNFNFHIEKGIFSFKIATDIEGLSASQTETIMSQIWAVGLQTYEKYAQGLRLIIEKGMAPKDVIGLIDG